MCDVSASPSTSTSTSAPAPTTRAALTSLLHDYEFAAVAKLLVEELDTTRSSQAVDWCTEFGVGAGHVLPLYYSVRNVLKWRDSGQVPTTEALFASVTSAVVLLVRVAQDVAACHRDLAKSGREFVYMAVRAKLWRWARQWRPTVLPRVADVVAAVETWFQAYNATSSSSTSSTSTPTPTPTPTLPLPVWAVAFGVSWPSQTTFTWGTPSVADRDAFLRNTTIASTRAHVLHNALGALRTMQTWEAVFMLPSSIMS
jgi:hypothetical protein